jgi:Methylase involved in ubiquinone/menaquinone biosynthesis
VDLGQNLQQLSEMYTNNKIVSLIRSDCLYLPFFKNTFDTVYSYGVFHHTISPQKAIDESLRVLKKNGILLFYVYSDHEYNFIKNKLIFIEKFVLNIFYVLPNIICKFLIFLFIMPFTYIFIIMPTLILRLIKKDKLADYFPLSFTTSASEIYHNLQDRLMAPINKRFSRKELFGILNKYNLQQVKIKTLDSGERSGHYVFIKK